MDVWDMPDLGCAFICGRPFALGGMRHKPIAVPVRGGADGNGPRYHSKLLVREDSNFYRLEDTFGGRLGLTIPHSLSGFWAVKRHLAPFKAISGSPLYKEEVGELHTPLNCLKALRENRIDVGPVDGYYYTLLARHNPQELASTRVVAQTVDYPMPFLAASPQVDDAICVRIRHGLFAAAALPEMQPVLEGLGLTGFAVPDLAEYAMLGSAPPE